LIRVLIAEDSVTVREMLMAVLSSDPEIQIVGMAKDGLEAVELAKALCPDLITMDIRMPKLDGFEATRRIMSEAPVPIVIVSATVDPSGVEISMQALRVGALAVARTPGGSNSSAFEEIGRQLIGTVKAMAQVKVVRRWPDRRSDERCAPTIGFAARRRPRVVAIAASTGGPAALHRLLSELSPDFPVPILLVQHIADGFVQGFAAWLNAASALLVKLAEPGEMLASKSVYVAPDNRHLGVSPRSEIKLSSAAPIDGFRPSASFLFESVAETFGASTLSIVLTGMGRDGVDGLKAVHAAGGTVLAQDEASSTVFGMSAEAITSGLVDRVLPLAAMARHITELVSIG
jgi:two-component system, chemotaxis family, protein-glutamate methylesterase/glutaminase